MPRSLEHLSTLKASESHFFKKFANKKPSLLFILNATNILRTIFGLESENLRTLECFLHIESSYKETCNE